MSLHFLDLGYADDPTFKWEGGDYSRNLPNTVVAFGSIGSRFVEAIGLLESPRYGGHRLDFGSIGARLTKSQVIQFLTEFYSGESQLNDMIRMLDSIPEERLCVR